MPDRLFNEPPNLEDLLQVLYDRSIELTLCEGDGSIKPHCPSGHGITDELREAMRGLKPELTQYLRERNWPLHRADAIRKLDGFFFAITSLGTVEAEKALYLCLKHSRHLFAAIDKRDLQAMNRVLVALAEDTEHWARECFPHVALPDMSSLDAEVKHVEEEVLPGQHDLFGGVHLGPATGKKKKKVTA